MNKAILIFAVLIAVFAYAEANRCRPFCRKGQSSPIRCVREGSQCRKILQCSIDEENCRRRLTKRPRITSTSMALCRNIKGPIGSGRCDVKRWPRSTRPKPPCSHIKCPDGNQKLNCYRNRRDGCQLLTVCQVERHNCLNPRNRIEWVDIRRCTGRKLQKCRPAPKKA